MVALNQIHKLLFFLSVIFCSTHAVAQFYQGSNMDFGKNRVQYRDFEWFYYPTTNFEVYYYQGGEDLAQYVLVSADRNIKDIQKFFDFQLEDKVQILSYSKQSEFRQSNIGISNDDQFNIGGAARIMGNKMFVYYEGDHESLEKQIRESLSKVVFNNMMYGGDWKDVLKSSTLLSIPKWYEEGIISYASQRRDPESEAFMRDVVKRKKMPGINRYEGKEARLAGHAFWAFVTDVYGENVIPNILYMTRLSRNVESGFLFVLGMNLDTITKEFNKYYKEKYGRLKLQQIPGAPAPLSPDATKAEKREWKKENKELGVIPVRYKKKYNYSQFEMSPDGSKIAFVTHEMGQYKIWLYDFEKKKLKRILKREYRLDRLPDESFPILAWHPTSGVLTYMFEKRGRAFIGNYNLEDKKAVEKELFRIEKVIDAYYSKDGKRILFSGVNKGRTDIYLYQVIGNNQEQLTDDVYDDINPRFIENDTRIIFASNRPDDTLRTDTKGELTATNKDIFIYNLSTRSNILERVTNSPKADERLPYEYSNRHFTYLSDETGIENRYIAKIDSAIARIDTTIHYRYFTTSSIISNFPRNPQDYHFNPSSGDYSLLFKSGGKPYVYLGNSEDDKSFEGTVLPTADNESKPTDRFEIYSFEKDSLAEDEVDIFNYVFEDERKDYAYEKESVRIQEITPEGTPATDTLIAKTLEIPKSRGYRLNFATDYVLSQVDNSFTNAFYQKFTTPTSINPGISGLIKFGLSDLFEDYKLVGGVRLAFDLQNNDFGVSFENLKGRIDRKFTAQRQAQTTLSDFNSFKVHTHALQYQWKYPFTELASSRLTVIGRQDRLVTSSTDPQSLVAPTFRQYQVGARLEYVFDNTVNRGLNLYNGTRYKIWVERYQRPEIFDQRSDFNILGFDFRHYKKIHRDLIFAFRLSGSTTFGRYKLAHYLGGVDNWLFQRVDNSLPGLDTAVFYHQTFMGPMRGFFVNARNGNSFALANAEIRWPVFKYFMKKPIKSDFIENFQIVTFFDAGSAWTGPSPYSNENLFNRTTVVRNPITVEIENNKDPIVYGYGFGLRSRVLGYFLRADWAWGVDDRRVLPRVFYLSLNLDF